MTDLEIAIKANEEKWKEINELADKLTTALEKANASLDKLLEAKNG